MPTLLTPEQRRQHKTHGRKKGFLKPKDEHHLKENLPRLTLPPATDRQQMMDAFEKQENDARLWMEIGFGNGDFLTHLAARHPQDRFIGIDLFLEGVSALLRKLERQESHNVRVVVDNAVIVLMERIPVACLDRVIINFPDPWPKKRHHKRRLVQRSFLDLLAPRMREGGELTLATDWSAYADEMLGLLEDHPAFHNAADSDDGFAPPPDDWIETRFQKKGRKVGRPAHHLWFKRRESPESFA